MPFGQKYPGALLFDGMKPSRTLPGLSAATPSASSSGGLSRGRVGVVLLLLSWGNLRAQNTPPPAVTPEVSLSAGQTLRLTVKPRVMQTVHVFAQAGRITELRMELPNAGALGRFVKVQPEPVSGPSVADPAISDSGQDFVRLPLAEGEITLHVTVLTNSRADAAPLETLLSLTEAEPTPARLEYAQAIRAFNHAERLRRSHTGSTEALASYNEALTHATATDDPVLEQQVLLSASRMLLLDGKHYADAVEWARRAVAVQSAESSPRKEAALGVQALAWKTLGGVLLDQDRYGESLEASRRALALYQKIGEEFWAGVVLENMGEALLSLGDLPEALRTDEEALAISRRIHDDFGVVEMLAEIGSVHRTRGEYQQALNDFSDAVEVSLPSAYNPMQGEAWLAMGELHLELGETQQAGTDFQQALTIAQQTTSGLDELDARSDIAGLALESGRVKDAQAEFTSALARARELKLVRPQSALLIGLARVELRSRHPERARPLLEEAITLSESIQQQVQTAEAYAALGESDEAAGQAKAAEGDWLKARELFAGVPDKAGEAQADVGLARVQAKAGEFGVALEHLREAMDIVESSRTSFARGALRTRFFSAQHAAYEAAVDLLVAQDKREPGHGYAVQAWQVAERARARSLLDELDAADAGQGIGKSAAQEKQLASLEVKIEALEGKRAGVGTDPAQLTAAAAIDAQLRTAILAADELSSRLRKTDSAAATALDRLTPANFAKAALGPQDALLEYWVGSRGRYLWAILPDGRCTSYTLPAETSLASIQAYRAALLSRLEERPGESLEARQQRIAFDEQKAGQFSRQLAADLFPAALRRRLAGSQRLVLVADGDLAQLSFAGLKYESGGPLKTNSSVMAGAYLVERFELVREPSAAYLMVSTHAAPVKRPLRVAVFADPVYNAADPRLQGVADAAGPKKTAADSPLAHVPRLAGSLAEAHAIAAIAGPERSSLFLGFQATPASVRKLDWARYPVAHFAVHAILQKDTPGSAGMLLSLLDSRGRPEDGILWVRQVQKRPVARDVVVLSGCDTALGETLSGEGVNSLARGFLFSGTRQVAATLWPADDTSSGILMKTFYEDLLRRGMGAAEALREAQLELLKQPRFAAPVYWAGFVVEGQWRTR